jgi:hypothetical protein
MQSERQRPWPIRPTVRRSATTRGVLYTDLVGGKRGTAHPPAVVGPGPRFRPIIFQFAASEYTEQSRVLAPASQFESQVRAPARNVSVRCPFLIIRSSHRNSFVILHYFGAE